MSPIGSGCVIAGLDISRMRQFLKAREPFFVVRRMIWSSRVDILYLFLCWGSCFHWVCMVFHHEYRIVSRMPWIACKVRPLLISRWIAIFCYAQLDLLFSALAFSVAFFATIPTDGRLILPTSSTTLTPPSHGGSLAIIGLCILPLFVSFAVCACWSTSSPMIMGPIHLCVQNLAIRVHTPCRTCAVFFDHQHRLQVEEWGCVVSHANLPILIGLYLCAKPLRHLQHLILFYFHIDGPEGIADLFNVGGIINHRHIPLTDIVEVLYELQLVNCGTDVSDSPRPPLAFLCHWCSPTFDCAHRTHNSTILCLLHATKPECACVTALALPRLLHQYNSCTHARDSQDA